jgi:hypothetical protein
VYLAIANSLSIGAVSVHRYIVDLLTPMAPATSDTSNLSASSSSLKCLPPLLIAYSGYFNHIAHSHIRNTSIANMRICVIVMTLPASISCLLLLIVRLKVQCTAITVTRGVLSVPLGCGVDSSIQEAYYYGLPPHRRADRLYIYECEFCSQARSDLSRLIGDRSHPDRLLTADLGSL